VFYVITDADHKSGEYRLEVWKHVMCL
jgi:hypothetical protein